MTAKRTEIRLAGTGGQGMILASVLLAEAALKDGKEVVQTQSYGPEARGGACRAEVVISDGEIYYQGVLCADVLLCMSQEACDRYAGKMREGGLLILDSSLVTGAPTTGAVRVPITQLAREATSVELTANVVALGLLVGLTGLVSQESLEAAVKARTPRGTEKMNLKALAAGFEAAGRAKQRG